MEIIQSNANRFESLRTVICELTETEPGKLPDAVQLGNRLKQLHRRCFDGRCFDSEPDGDNFQLWKVVKVAQESDAAEAAEAVGH